MPTKVFRVIVKFRDTVNVPYADDIGSRLEQQGVVQWTQLAAQYQGIRIVRLYRSTDATALHDLVSRAEGYDHTYKAPNLLTFFVVETPTVAAAQGVAGALRVRPLVEYAYQEPEAHSPSGVSPGSYALNAGQGYEDDAPVGIGVRCAWNRHAGADGSGQSVIDCEVGWTLDHQDFVAHHPALLFGAIDSMDISHGTSVLGVVCASGNLAGIVGIAPAVASVNVVSYKADATSDPATATIPEAIAQAMQHLLPGNVLLLEIELNFLPVETDPACFTAIRLATAAGICVVEAAGNGNQNLDKWADPAGRHLLFRSPTNKFFTDSGAIIVAAATTGNPHARRASSNFGTRVDCYAWGDSVLTSQSLGPSDKASHTVAPEFANTSAAAAIVAGAALSVQGMREAAGLPRLDPIPLRTALGMGTPSADPIGVMPDLCAIGATMPVRPPITSPMRAIKLGERGPKHPPPE